MSATAKQLVVIEVPHQRPARVYLATEMQLIAWALENEADYLMENSLYESDDSITFDDACEALGHDLHRFATYESVEEAKQYEIAGKGHQHLRVMAELEKLQ